MRLSKSVKASLSLSVNAIVILILAMAMLGLGLTFTTRLFGGAAGKLGEVVEGTSLKNPPSADNPLTIDDKVAVKRKGEKEMEIGFYNIQAGAVYNARLNIIECQDTSGHVVPPTLLPTIAAPKQSIVESSGSAGYKAVLKIPTASPGVAFPAAVGAAPAGPATDALPAATYICNMIVEGTPDAASAVYTTKVSKQFFLQVTG